MSKEPGPAPVDQIEKRWLALALTWVGGFVDAVGYITLYHLFTAHMSGNSVGLGVALGQGDWLEAVHRVTPILAYVPAVALAAVVVEVGRRRHLRRTAALVLSAEAAALVAAIGVGSQELVGGRFDTETGGIYYLVAALLAGAMGLQSASLRRVAGHTVRTNFVTGVLTNLAETGVVGLFERRDVRRGLGSGPSPCGRAALLAGIWAIYLVGAVAGAELDGRWQLRCLALPVAVVTGAAVADVLRPIRPTLAGWSSGADRAGGEGRAVNGTEA